MSLLYNKHDKDKEKNKKKKEYLSPEELAIQENIKYGDGVPFSPNMLTTEYTEGKKQHKKEIKKRSETKVEYDTRNAYEKKADAQAQGNIIPDKWGNIVKPFLPSLIGGYMFNSPDDATNPINLINDMVKAGNYTAGNLSKIVTGGHKGSATLYDMEKAKAEGSDKARSDAAWDIGTQLLVGKAIQTVAPLISSFGKGFSKGYSRAKTSVAPEKAPTYDVSYTEVPQAGPGPRKPSTFDNIKDGVRRVVDTKYRDAAYAEDIRKAKLRTAIKFRDRRNLVNYVKDEHKPVAERILKTHLDSKKYSSNSMNYLYDRETIKWFRDLPIKEKLRFIEDKDYTAFGPFANLATQLIGRKPTFPVDETLLNNRKYTKRVIQREANKVKKLASSYRNSAEERGMLMNWEPKMNSYLEAAKGKIDEYYRPKPVLASLLQDNKTVVPLFNNKKGVVNVKQLKAVINSPKKNLPKADVEILNTVLDTKFANSKNVSLKELKQATAKYTPAFKREYVDTWSDYGLEHIGVTSPEENRTVLLHNEAALGKGSDLHFDSSPLGHLRYFIEDGKLKFVEAQSDYYQKNEKRLLDEYEYSALLAKKDLEEAIANGEPTSMLAHLQELADYHAAEIQKRKLRENIRPGIDMRLVYESMILGKEKGKTHIYFPTPETAAKIQGYRKVTTKEHEHRKELDAAEKEFESAKDIFKSASVKKRRLRAQRNLEELKGNKDKARDLNSEIFTVTEAAEKEFEARVGGPGGVRERIAELKHRVKQFEDNETKGHLEKLETLQKEIDAKKKEHKELAYTFNRTRTYDPRYNELADKLTRVEREFQSLKNAHREEERNIEYILGELPHTATTDYKPEHKTILYKYAKRPREIQKHLKIKPEIETDALGYEWYKVLIPSNILRALGEFRAHRRGGILHKI